MLKFTALLDATLDEILEDERPTHTSPLESFDMYANRIKEQYHSVFNQYIESIQHGYGVIIDKIKDQIKE